MKFLVLDNVYIKGKNIKNDPPSPIWLPLTCYLKSTHTLTCNPVHGTLTQLCKSNRIVKKQPRIHGEIPAEDIFHKS